MAVHSIEVSLGGRALTIETGKFAVQADGAVTVRCGDTVILVTVCSSKPPYQRFDFFPLTVDYEERLYAAGKIPGGFLRREGRPSQAAILAARLVDRPIRPLFPKGFLNEVQVIITVLSADQENMPEVMGVVGASAALSLSSVPFEGPIGAVRVGYINNKFVLNPTFTELQDSKVDVVVVGTREKVVMLEAGAQEASEDLILEAIRVGQEANGEIIKAVKELQRTAGKPKVEFVAEGIAAQAEAEICAFLEPRVCTVLEKNRADREQAIADLKAEALRQLGETYAPSEILSLCDQRVKSETRKAILDKGRRPDGRGIAEIRPIGCETGLLPRTHGSGFFTRGMTHVLTTTTLGSVGDEQPLDGLSLEESKRFMHHYYFPPYSAGETRRVGTPGRREIGHGALVERALGPIIPDVEDFPYAVRLVSEVLSSNGSTSMASVCAGTLSLMDAGVPIKAPVAGIAMGLITGPDDRYVVLTDIEGMEDACGDMDFKIAGTSHGITAVQLDIKLKGISNEIVEKAVRQAREARLFILKKMQETIAEARPELSKYAPRMIKITIDPHKIGSVIGPGGKTIRSIIEETKTTINVENDGTVYIGSVSEEAAQTAIRRIEALTKEVEVGALYTGKVTRLFNFGAMVEILPGKEALVHISELATYRVPSVEDVVKIGDEITVIVTGIDRQGRINVSRRAVLQGANPGADQPEARGGRDRDRGDRPGGEREGDNDRGGPRRTSRFSHSG